MSKLEPKAESYARNAPFYRAQVVDVNAMEQRIADLEAENLTLKQRLARVDQRAMKSKTATQHPRQTRTKAA